MLVVGFIYKYTSNLVESEKQEHMRIIYACLLKLMDVRMSRIESRGNGNYLFKAYVAPGTGQGVF